MTSNLVRQSTRVLLAAGFAVGVAAAQAASGYNVQPSQETQVTPGMTQAEVMQVLGKPAENLRFPNEPGPTYEYRVLGHDAIRFDVDFDASGNVASAGERVDVLNSRGGSSGL